MATPRRPAEELTPDQYGDQLASTALAIVEDMREVNPYQLLEQLAFECQHDPVRMAQVVMALAAMVPVEDGVKTITDRVWAISTPRCTTKPGSAA